MTTIFPQCYKCKHYEGANSCKAFTEIPNEITQGKHNHEKPLKGDNGIQFEPLRKGVLYIV